jgi:hypothetical protein
VKIKREERKEKGKRYERGRPAAKQGEIDMSERRVILRST